MKNARLASVPAAALLVIALATLLGVPAFAGVVYEIQTTDHQGNPDKPISTEIAAEGGLLKMTLTAGEGEPGGEMIFRSDRREMVVVDRKNESYMVMDEAFVEGLAGQINSAMSQMQEALKNVPEAQRAMVEKMMKERMPQAAAPGDKGPKHELRKTSEKSTQNGFPCVKYEVLQNDRKVRELWVTDWSNLEGSDEVRPVFEEMADFFSNMLAGFEQLAGAGGKSGMLGTLTDNPMTYMREIGGFPVVTRGFEEDGSLEDESLLRSATRQTLDPAAFEPPAGYKRQEMPGF